MSLLSYSNLLTSLNELCTVEDLRSLEREVSEITVLSVVSPGVCTVFSEATIPRIFYFKDH